MASPASVDDLIARWWNAPALTSAQEDVITQRLEDAWDMLRDRRPTLEADITAETVRSSTVIRVLCEMVLRVARNPDGKFKESVDDYSFERSPGAAEGILFVSPAELSDITPGRATRRSIRLVAYGDD